MSVLEDVFGFWTSALWYKLLCNGYMTSDRFSAVWKLVLLMSGCLEAEIKIQAAETGGSKQSLYTNSHSFGWKILIMVDETKGSVKVSSKHLMMKWMETEEEEKSPNEFRVRRRTWSLTSSDGRSSRRDIKVSDVLMQPLAQTEKCQQCFSKCFSVLCRRGTHQTSWPSEVLASNVCTNETLRSTLGLLLQELHFPQVHHWTRCRCTEPEGKTTFVSSNQLVQRLIDTAFILFCPYSLKLTTSPTWRRTFQMFLFSIIRLLFSLASVLIWWSYRWAQHLSYFLQKILSGEKTWQDLHIRVVLFAAWWRDDSEKTRNSFINY